MGYTSITKEVNTGYAQALIVGKDLTEASDIAFFHKKKYHLASLFPYAEICDNGKIRLYNNMGAFATFE